MTGSRVLVVGLDPYRVPGPWDPEPVINAINTGMERLAASGVLADRCLVGLDGSEDIESRIITALAEKRYECVVVGGGIRTADELLELFETVVNLVHRHAPQADIAFNSGAEDIFTAVARRLDPTRS